LEHPKNFPPQKNLGAGYATEFGHRISLWVLIWPSDKLHVHGSIHSCHTYVCAPLQGRWRTGALTPFTFQKRGKEVGGGFLNSIIGKFMTYQDRLETN